MTINTGLKFLGLGAFSGLLSGISIFIPGLYWILPGIIFGALIFGFLLFRQNYSFAQVVACILLSVAGYTVAFFIQLAGDGVSANWYILATGLAGFCGSAILGLSLFVCSLKVRFIYILRLVTLGTIMGLVFGLLIFASPKGDFWWISKMLFGFMLWQSLVAHELARLFNRAAVQR